MSADDPIVSLQNVRFSWPGQSQKTLDIDTFELQRGEKLFLHGPSGSGKSTLLSVIAAVLQPQSGSVFVDGVDLNTLNGADTDRFRADHIGLVFQQFNLLPFLNIQENVELPCRFSAIRRRRVREQGTSLHDESRRLLQAMRLPNKLLSSRTAMQLSVGQQQRVAVARALMGRPPLIIADEPTSSLDADARGAFLKLLFSEIAESAATLLFVSHDVTLQSYFDRSLALEDLNKASAPAAWGEQNA